MSETQQVRPARPELPCVFHRLREAQMGDVWLQAEAVEDEDWCRGGLEVGENVVGYSRAVGYVRHGVLDREAETHEVFLVSGGCYHTGRNWSARTT